MSLFDEPTDTIQDSTGQEIEQATGNDGGNIWGGVLDFGNTLVQNSGQLASVFSPKYREDQIALQQATQPNQTVQNKQDSNKQLYITLAIVIAVIVILVLILKKKKK